LANFDARGRGNYGYRGGRGGQRGGRGGRNGGGYNYGGNRGGRHFNKNNDGEIDPHVKYVANLVMEPLNADIDMKRTTNLKKK
jgi:hypothetical protein